MRLGKNTDKENALSMFSSMETVTEALALAESQILRRTGSKMQALCLRLRL
jgi:hypothetical protein